MAWFTSVTIGFPAALICTLKDEHSKKQNFITFLLSDVQPAASGRQLISCGPPVLAKFVRNMRKKSSKRQNLT